MGRQMVKVVNYVKVGDEDELDVLFWQTKTPADRLQEVMRLRKNYYTWLNGSFPQKITKVATTRPIDQ